MLFDYEIHQPPWDNDLLDDRLAFQPRTHFFIGFCSGDEILVRDVRRNLDLAAEFAKHLDRDLDRRLDEKRLVANRPRLVGQRRVVAQQIPQLFADVGANGDSSKTNCSMANIGRTDWFVKKLTNSIIRAIAVLKPRVCMSRVTAYMVCATHAVARRWRRRLGPRRATRDPRRSRR